MKSKKSKIYIFAAFACAILIIGTVYYYLFTDLTNNESTQYLYIDGDDTQDSVFAKLSKTANHHAMTGFRTIARHSDYAENIHTGRFAILPGEVH